MAQKIDYLPLFQGEPGESIQGPPGLPGPPGPPGVTTVSVSNLFVNFTIIFLFFNSLSV